MKVTQPAHTQRRLVQQQQREQRKQEEKVKPSFDKMTDTEMARADGEPATTATAPAAEEEKQDFKLELADKVN